MAGFSNSSPPIAASDPHDDFVVAEQVQPAAPNPLASDRPVPLRELLAVGLFVLLADLLIYRGGGYAGPAAFLVLAPLLLLLGAGRLRPRASLGVVSGMLVLLALRSVWLGSWLGMICGTVLVVAFGLAMYGHRPYLPELAVHGAFSFVSGFMGWLNYAASFLKPVEHRSSSVPFWALLSVGLPLAVVVLFSLLFIQANPDLVTAISTSLEQFGAWLEARLNFLSFEAPEVVFCVWMGLLVVGLLRPLFFPSLKFETPQPTAAKPVAAQSQIPFYHAIRNTLVAVSVLFAVYLIFEFQTLWFRTFPKGFYYAGYAHQGAAWLTAALALATLVLSLIFRGDVLNDDRLPRLRRWAWLWSGLNLLLALSVYNRMYIYIDFNGMTRMRTIGLFGISAVVVGFCLVLWKIVRGRDFTWLIRQQLATVALAVYLFALTPVDYLVHSYNVWQIKRGDLAPAVQISVHPINAEGYLAIEPLVDCDDPIIREGVRAMLAERAIAGEKTDAKRAQRGWTARQLADERLLARLRTSRTKWQMYRDDQRRAEAIKRFDDYAYQWY